MNFKNVMRFAMVMVAGGFVVSSVFAAAQPAAQSNVRYPPAAHGTLTVVAPTQKAPAQGGMVMVNVAPNKVDRVVSIATDDCQYHKAGRLFFYLECGKCLCVDVLPLTCLRKNNWPISQQCRCCPNNYKITLMHYQKGELTGKEVFGLKGSLLHFIGTGACDSVQDIIFFRANFGLKVTAEHFKSAATLETKNAASIFKAVRAAYIEDNSNGEKIIESLMQQCRGKPNTYRKRWFSGLQQRAMASRLGAASTQRATVASRPQSANTQDATGTLNTKMKTLALS